MTSQELRKKFIDFFEKKGHKKISPSSLIPENDPSVLFTTAGVQQFKKFYQKPQESPAKRVVTVQPSFRTSDIDEVGDNTHLTFFEMLGNFSFGNTQDKSSNDYFEGTEKEGSRALARGSYFKKETVDLAIGFLTQELGFKLENLEFFIFGGDKEAPRDVEAEKILADRRILNIKEGTRGDNFWGPTGEEGPCGPTIDIYINGIEIWSLVFNQYYKDKNGKYSNLQYQGVDTGMGLERMLAVLDKQPSVYETDILAKLITEIQEETKSQLIKQEQKISSARILADHIRGIVFLLSEGVYPGNKGQAYVLRRLIRRAVVHTDLLSIKKLFLAQLGEIVIKEYGKTYPILAKKQQDIINSLNFEEEKFRKTLENGLKEFEKISQKGNISGEDAFHLFDTFGFPIELTEELAAEKKLKVDRKSFNEAFKQHQEISRAGVSGFKGGLVGATEKTTRYHTATHLLLKALQIVLGKDIHQRGSNINEERLRLDFSYPNALTEDEVKKVEDLVNEKIAEKLPVIRTETTFEKAKALGAEAQFEDKYSKHEKLTMYSIGDFSHELCGGPHVKNTSELGYFKIIKEESSSAGVRRIRAVLE